MAITAKMRGEGDLVRKFNGLNLVGQRAVLIIAGLAGGLIIQNEAKRLVHKDTRTLARSIHMEVTE